MMKSTGGSRYGLIALTLIISLMFFMGCDSGGGGSDLTTWYEDSDGDGYGDPNSTTQAAAKPAGYVSDSSDCADTNQNIFPDAPELCDGVDNQCPGDSGYGSADEGCPMVPIPSGCFDMGDTFSEGAHIELPVHNVCITSDFYMDVHEVTNAEYADCVSAGGCSPPSDLSSNTRVSYYGNTDYDNFPVIYVSWNQATEYCTWAGKRLPTEAEWEYAARGGLSGNRYPWGDTISNTDANYQFSGGPWDGDTSPVEYFIANGYGLYDMAGNVWEWVNDRYHAGYYSVSPINDPPGPDSGSDRVCRGGSWRNDTISMRVANRSYGVPTAQGHDLGFRCAGD